MWHLPLSPGLPPFLITCNACISPQTSCSSGTHGRPATARTWWRTYRGDTRKCSCGLGDQSQAEKCSHTAPGKPGDLVLSQSPRPLSQGRPTPREGPLLSPGIQMSQPQSNHCQNLRTAVATGASSLAGNLATVIKITSVHTEQFQSREFIQQVALQVSNVVWTGYTLQHVCGSGRLENTPRCLADC